MYVYRTHHEHALFFFFMKTYSRRLVWTPLSPITVINCTHKPYHINIFSAYLLNKIKTYNNKKYPTM